MISETSSYIIVCTLVLLKYARRKWKNTEHIKAMTEKKLFRSVLIKVFIV